MYAPTMIAVLGSDQLVLIPFAECKGLALYWRLGRLCLLFFKCRQCRKQDSLCEDGYRLRHKTWFRWSRLRVGPKVFSPGYRLIVHSWEYPGKQGLGCNVVNGEDAGNFLEYLQELRAHPIGAKIILSAATAITPFAGPDGKPLEDVSGFAKVLDFISVMNYDLSGPGFNTLAGPNAPLRDGCSPHQKGSATSAIRDWNKAGIPYDQLVLGVPAYGHSFRVHKADAYAPGTTRTLATFPPPTITNLTFRLGIPMTLDIPMLAV